MRNSWQIQEAKSKFSELIELASREGPQRITKHGKDAAVVLSTKDYDRLSRKKGSMREFFCRSPLRHIKIERSRELPRDIEL
jgi:antitoxin Phd